MQHEKIHYIEFHCRHMAKTRVFFEKVFSWVFTDYGENYCAFSEKGGLEGGFFKSNKAADTQQGSALVVLYSNELENTQKKIIAAGGKITKPIFHFPGGRRFHFCEPSGNELSVWSAETGKKS